MINAANANDVGTYFNPDSNTRFYIPKYQREYVWGKDNWEDLYNDLDDSPKGHFLGSIICVNTQKDSMAGARLELIDGQQRFTTIYLFLCALYKKLQTSPNPDQDFFAEMANLKNRVFIKSTNLWRLEPSEQLNNKTDLQQILSELFPKLVPSPTGLKNYGNRRIAKAFHYFCGRLETVSIEDALIILEKLKAALLVKIEVASHSDAYVLFKTINDRGIPLSAIDIIKNNLLAELDKVPDYGIDHAFAEWTELIDFLPDLAIQERFLRQLYNAFRYLKHVDVKGCTRATRSNLITIYDALLHKRPVWLFCQLRSKAKVYSALLNPSMAEHTWGADTASSLKDLQHLGAAPAYALLLWAEQVAVDQGWSIADTISQLATTLTKWFFWRNLTDSPPTRDLDPMLMELMGLLLQKLRKREIAGLPDFMACLQDWLYKKIAPKEKCEALLKGDAYLENYDSARFLLCKVEEAHHTREKQRDLWEQNSADRPVFTVEHILPKTENLGTQWVEMLEKDSSETAENIRQRCVHQLGNLTLSGHNAKLGTMDFVRKRERKNEKGDYIGYRNGLYLNNELATRNTWDEAAIVARTERLCEEAIALLGVWEP